MWYFQLLGHTKIGKKSKVSTSNVAKSTISNNKPREQSRWVPDCIVINNYMHRTWDTSCQTTHQVTVLMTVHAIMPITWIAEHYWGQTSWKIQQSKLHPFLHSFDKHNLKTTAIIHLKQSPGQGTCSFEEKKTHKQLVYMFNKQLAGIRAAFNPF